MSYNGFGFQQPQQTGPQQQGYQPFQQQQQQQAFQSFQQAPQPSTNASKYDQLSFLSPSDQQKFETLFNRHTSTVSISPESARSILLKSQLAPQNLARIWELCDINKSGDLLFPEFALALHLCNIVLNGQELPYHLDSHWAKEVGDQVDKINFNIPEGGDDGQRNEISAATTTGTSDVDILERHPVFNQPELFASPQKAQNGQFQSINQPTGFGFQNPEPQSGQQTGYQYNGIAQQQQLPQSTGFNQSSLQPTEFTQQSFPQAPLNQQSTGFMPLKSQNTGIPIQRQQTGLPSLSLSSEQTGGFSQGQSTQLNQQPTGMNSSKLFNQPTGLNIQSTGFIPLNSQQTAPQASAAQPLTQQPTGLVPLQTGSLTQQPTGLVPLQTGSLTQQPTGLVPLQTQPTGSTSGTQATVLQQQPTGTALPLTQQPTGLVPLKQQPTGAIVPLNSQPTGPLIPLQTGNGIQPHSTGLIPLKTGVPFEPLKQQKTGYGTNSFFLTNLVQQSDTFAKSFNFLTQSTISSDEKKLFNKIFDNYDTDRRGLLSSDICAEIFRKSGLNREDLEEIWDLISRPNQTHLDKDSFQLGMWLVYKKLNGFQIPSELPESLKPSSVKILDDVKNRLRVHDGSKTLKKSSNSKIDGSRFKNNDDELNTSSSRHRRRTPTSDATATQKRSEKLSIEQMKKLIHEKKILLDAFEVQREESVADDKDYERGDQLAIESLKEQLRNLPERSGTSGPQSLKSKFLSLTSRVPDLIKEISSLDYTIKNLKIELFRLQNPSTLIGSGPGGEITDQDRVKAKSKLLLAQKMSKLTGKPVDPALVQLANDATQLNEQVAKIQQENQANQQMIKDVESSITEISSSVMSSLSQEVDGDEYRKWELGVGLQPEVQEIVKSFRVSYIKDRVSQPELLSRELPSVQQPQPQLEQPVSSNVSSTRSSRISSPIPRAYQTAEEKKAYIKEQARLKMQERMAKLGINRRISERSSPTTSSPRSPPVAIDHVEQARPEEDSSSDSDDEAQMELIRQRKREEREARLGLNQ